MLAVIFPVSGQLLSIELVANGLSATVGRVHLFSFYSFELTTMGEILFLFSSILGSRKPGGGNC